MYQRGQASLISMAQMTKLIRKRPSRAIDSDRGRSILGTEWRRHVLVAGDPGKPQVTAAARVVKEGGHINQVSMLMWPAATTRPCHEFAVLKALSK
jgi:hypothetical protein